MRFLQLVAFVMLFMGSLHGEAAAAEPPAAPADPKSDVVSKADTLFREGRRFVAEQKWAQAEQKFLAAWRLNPTFDVATNLGHTQVQLSKYREAAENLAFALRNWPIIPEMTKRRALAQKQLDEVRPFVAALSVRVNMPDAAIVVDGQRVGTSPMRDEIFLDPGAHTIEATLAGHDKAAQKIEGAKGSMLSVSLTLKPAAALNTMAAPPKVESLTKTQQETKQPEVKPQPVKGQPVTPSPIKPERTPQGSKLPVRTIVIGTGAATTAVLIGTGIGLVVAANQKGADVSTRLDALEKQNGPSPCFVPWRNVSACNEVVKLSNEQTRFANGAIWTFVAGGVVGTGTLAYALITRKRKTPESSAIQVHPVVGAGGTAVVVRGQW